MSIPCQLVLRGNGVEEEQVDNTEIDKGDGDC